MINNEEAVDYHHRQEAGEKGKSIVKARVAEIVVVGCVAG